MICSKHSFFFDFFTIWSHVFYMYSLYAGTNLLLLCGRLLVMITYVFGTLILLARGEDTMPAIRKQIYIGIPHFVIDYIGQSTFAWLIDLRWHGVSSSSIDFTFGVDVGFTSSRPDSLSTDSINWLRNLGLYLFSKVSRAFSLVNRMYCFFCSSRKLSVSFFWRLISWANSCRSS